MNDETRITDYALGELDDAAREEVQAELAMDAEARQAAAEIGLLGKMLRVATPQAVVVRDGDAAVSDASQKVALRSTLEQHLPGSTPGTAGTEYSVLEYRRNRRRALIAGGLVIAASITLMVTLSGRLEPQRELAHVSSSPFVANEDYDVGKTANIVVPSLPAMPNSLPTGAVPAALSSNVGGPNFDSGGVNNLTLPLGPATPPIPNGTLGDGLVTAQGYGATLTLGSGGSISGAITLTGGGSVVHNPVPGDRDDILVFDQPSKHGNGTRMPGEWFGSAVYLHSPESSKRRDLASLPSTAKPDDPSKKKPEPGRYGERNLKPDTVHNTEAYDKIVENPFLKAYDNPLSTFSIDVDTASYSNARRFLTAGQLPPPGAVRVEEFLNYFTYNYPQPKDDVPFSVTTEAVRCPWNSENVLVRVGLKGREIHRKERPATNLVFLIDVSGSMSDANKLPLVRESLKLMVRELGDRDRVAIVVYAGSTGLVLPSTGGDRKQTILEAIDRLDAGGSTNGAAGITLAYQVAKESFIKGGVNRVVLATDGDFNVGVTSQDELTRLIEEKAKTNIFFSALGYGMGNLKDSTLEKLADKGNGNYSYIDTLAEARKVLVEQMSGTLVTIAKDVKIQIEFNPLKVESYRLLGYENRIMAAEDFNNDKKDAGEIGAGHTVTALYELVPVGKPVGIIADTLPKVNPSKYQQPRKMIAAAAPAAAELFTLHLRYKQPDATESKEIVKPQKDDVRDYAKASADTKFAAAVAAFGMVLRQSAYRGTATYDAVLELAQEGIGRDTGGYRREFLELVRKARELKKP